MIADLLRRRRTASRRRILVGCSLGALALITIPAGSAHAALVSTGACDNAWLTQPFAAWSDTSPYKGVPGGNFEGSLTGWTLTGGAHVVSGNESFDVAGGTHSLDLPAGASVTTPLTCVNAAYPTARFFSKGGGLLSTVAVQLVYQNPILGLVPLPAGVTTLSTSWKPTLPMLTLSAVPGLLDGGTSQVAIRFTALLGPSQIDDIYVDPRMKG
jgi:hypothetical protein